MRLVGICCMGEWTHKTREFYSIAHYQDSKNGYDFRTSDKKKMKSFDEWLDMQCVGGWEVIKIEKIPQSRMKVPFIWCVFRRQK